MKLLCVQVIKDMLGSEIDTIIYTIYTQHQCLIITVVREQFMVGDIHEKKICGKNLLSWQVTDHCKLYLFVVRKFCVLKFHRTRFPTKSFLHQFFPNYGKNQ